ncbi:hypothetical protein [Treponema endosymbiont of Eucomonympha sp.]|uniref:hypothetical protein n=1 Tax=Treponema endosymbiont of Eucomonympha sp. TaxID=1580831 RepID=UPI000B041084|nr:hypothetical protein [Treponema endosymbiont of Eucomonympha sp.]
MNKKTITALLSSVAIISAGIILACGFSTGTDNVPGENDGNIAFYRGAPPPTNTSGTYEFSFKNGFTTSKYCVKRPSEDRGPTDVKMTRVYLRSEAEAKEWAEELKRERITASNWGYASGTNVVSFASSQLSKSPKTTSAALIGVAIP